MSEQKAKRTFQICPISSFHWASWDDEYVVFDEASGQTHLLDPVKAYVLDALSDGPASVESLAPTLLGALAYPAEADPHRSNPHELIAGALEQLERSHLVEAVSL